MVNEEKPKPKTKRPMSCARLVADGKMLQHIALPGPPEFSPENHDKLDGIAALWHICCDEGARKVELIWEYGEVEVEEP